MCGFCNVWVCVCVGFVMCGCVCVGFLRVGVLVKCILVFIVFVLFRLRMFLFVTGIRTTATEWKHNCSK